MAGPTKPVVTRVRPLVHMVDLGKGENYIGGVHSSSRIGDALVGIQKTVSESNPVHLIEQGTSSDVGSGFFTTKTHALFSKLDGVHAGDKSNVEYVGNVFYGPTSLSFENFGLSLLTHAQPSSVSSLEALGTTAIARVSPTNPHASLAVALGETYRDGLPHVMPASIGGSHRPHPSTGSALGDRAAVVRNAGEDYLNVEFGFVPLISDVKSLMKSVMDTHALLKNYSRNANKPIHKRYDFPDVATKLRTDENAAIQPILVSQCYSDGNPIFKADTEENTVRKRWFVGCFVYPDLIGDTGGLDHYYHLASYLYGLDLNPSTLWQLAPWSWLIDWFTNLGDIIKNITNFTINGLVLRYGYVMETTTYTKVAQGHGFCTFKQGPTFSDPRYEYGVITKYRVKATPFGFGFDLSTLTPTQIAILAALGITLFL